MNLFDAVEKRHSYRGGFRDVPVPREDLRKLVQAGLQAPSGCNAQTTSFVIVDDPAVLAKLADIMDRPVVRAAKAVIVCVSVLSESCVPRVARWRYAPSGNPSAGRLLKGGSNRD